MARYNGLFSTLCVTSTGSKGFPIYAGCDMLVVYELVLDEESLKILEKLLKEAEEENGEETGNTCS